MRRVVVTGVGLMCPVGTSAKESWEEALAGRSGIGSIECFDASEATVKIAAEVGKFDASSVIDPKELKRTTRYVQLAAMASNEAVRDAGLDFESDNTEKWGCSIGVGLGALQDIENSCDVMRTKGHRRISPFFLPYTIPNMGAGLVSKYFNLKRS